MEQFWRACMEAMMGGGGGVMMLGMILFWVALLALAALGLRWLWRRARRVSGTSAERH